MKAGRETGSPILRTKDVGTLSQWQLIRIRFQRHKLALLALHVLIVLYLAAVFAEFFAPYTVRRRDLAHAYCPPQRVRWTAPRGLHVYAATKHVDPVTLQRSYVEDPGHVIPLRFFARGEAYRLWGVVRMNRHFFGVDAAGYGRNAGNRPRAPRGLAEPACYLLGADRYGRDILTRIIYGSRISLSIGLVSILITFVIGITFGGLSGYFGGGLDNFIQRSIEVINAFPHLPLWLAFAAVMPPDWPALRVYFAITIVLSLIGWTGLARVVRGKILSLREEDYALAARLLGASHTRIIFRHLVPGFTSHIIVVVTLSVPAMILGETALSFLGLGLRPPIVSWGVMLQDCLQFQTVAHYPWLLLPTLAIVLTVLSFNFLGDGLRDAADPYAATGS